METGRITGSEKAINKDGDQKVLLLQVEISDPDDIQTIELFTHAGVDYTPPDESNVLILQIGSAWKIGFAVDDGIEKITEKGEYKTYSSVDGVVKSYMFHKKDGTMLLNGDDDNAVRYSELKTAFDQLKTDFDAFVDIFNVHTQPVSIPSATANAPVTPAIKTTASIDAAKVDSVKVPKNG